MGLSELDEAHSRVAGAVAGAQRSLSLAGLGLERLPPELASATALRELDLSGNRLTELPPWLGGLTALRRLDLRGNELVEIPAWLGALRLGSLELADNRHLVSPPPQVVAEGGAAVAAYVRNLRSASQDVRLRIQRIQLPTGRRAAVGALAVTVVAGALAFAFPGGGSGGSGGAGGRGAQAVGAATRTGDASQGPLTASGSPVLPAASSTPNPASRGQLAAPANPPAQVIRTTAPGTRTTLATPQNPVGVVAGFASMCLDDRGANASDYNPVQEFTCNGTDSQQWTVVAAGNTLRVFGKCLDVYAAGTADGSAVDIYHCNGTGAQVWIPRADGSLYNPSSGKCLDDTDWSSVPGRQLQIWSCSGNANQKWGLP